MLQAAELAVGIARLLGEVRADEAELGRHAQKRDVAEVPGELRVLVRVRQDQVLHREFDVDHSAVVVLEVEEPGAVGMGRGRT